MSDEVRDLASSGWTPPERPLTRTDPPVPRTQSDDSPVWANESTASSEPPYRPSAAGNEWSAQQAPTEAAWPPVGNGSMAPIGDDGVSADGPEAPSDAKSERDPVTKFLIEWVPLLTGAVVFALIVRAFLFTAYEIPSQSMVPTLDINDRVIVNRLSYNFHDINRGDVVVFDRPASLDGDTDVLIKRVIGLPGETVSFRNGNVYVDDFLVEESYIASPESTFPLVQFIPNCVQEDSFDSCVVPEGHVLVLGDNRLKSSDGRVFGPIPEDDIVGRAFVKIWPVGDIGGL